MIAFLYPGQGAQKIGMGQDICAKYEEADRIFEQASGALGYDMKKLVFEGDEQELMITENTQPALLTVSMAITEVLKKHMQPDYTAGLSIGEYAAHVCAGTIDFADAVQTVRLRGRYMQEAVPLGKGGMAAIIGLAPELVEEACEAASKKGTVEAANYNCPGQIVIAGEAEAVEYACVIAKEKGARRAVPLAVSAPFHCSLMRPAGEKLEPALKKLDIHDFTIPVCTNVTAQKIENKDEIVDLLVRQVSSPVRWEDSIRFLLAQGVDTFIEVGPGKALTGFMKKIDKEARMLHVEDIPSLEETLTALKEG